MTGPVTPPRTLVVIRHAEAVATAGGDDLARPLTGRGAADARDLGRWLRDAVTAPDLVLCSDAVRTRATWEAAAAELDTVVPVRHTLRAYLASAAQWSELVREVGDEVGTLVLLGHAPGVSELAAALLGDADALASTALAGGLPCAAAVVLTVPAPWHAHRDSTCTLRVVTVAGR